MAERLAWLAPWLDGAVLVLLAAFIFHLVWNGGYWYYLNPKFQWLTVTAGSVTLALGLLAPPRRARRLDFSRYLLFGILLWLCWFGGADTLFRPQARAGGLGGTQAPGHERPALPGLLDEEDAPQGPSRVTRDGREYVRINVAELYDLSDKKAPQLADTRYVLRGFVVRHPELLDSRDSVGLFRIALTCCFADATAAGFIVRDVSEAAARGGVQGPLEGGQWVNVYGRVEPETLPRTISELRVKGIFSTSIQPGWVLRAEAIEPIEPPEPAFMYAWRTQEPFAY